MKKIRKELTKKLDINIDEKHKEYFQIVKTPMERKISKSHKGSKSRLKKEDEK